MHQWHHSQIRDYTTNRPTTTMTGADFGISKRFNPPNTTILPEQASSVILFFFFLIIIPLDLVCLPIRFTQRLQALLMAIIHIKPGAE